jgi:hypothetical protein
MYLNAPAPLPPQTLQLVRLPLSHVGDDVRMVESLAPIWDEERQRAGGAMPPPAPEAPRTPQLLSLSVEAVRQQFADIVAQHQQQGLPPPVAQPSPPSPLLPASLRSPLASLDRQALMMTQVASLAVPANSALYDSHAVQWQGVGLGSPAGTPQRQTTRPSHGATPLVSPGGGGLVDRAIVLSQFPSNQPQGARAAGGQPSLDEVAAWLKLQREIGFEEGEDSKGGEDDLLMALAQQAQNGGVSQEEGAQQQVPVHSSQQVCGCKDAAANVMGGREALLGLVCFLTVSSLHLSSVCEVACRPFSRLRQRWSNYSLPHSTSVKTSLPAPSLLRTPSQMIMMMTWQG